MAKRYNFLTRCLAAVALLFVYVVSSGAILVGEPRRRRRPGVDAAAAASIGRRRLLSRTRLAYRGYYAPAPTMLPRAYSPRCYWSYRWGRTVCRY